MRVAGRRLSRGELALVAAALGVPVPLVALSGYMAALPDALGRGLSSLVTLESDARADGGVRRDAFARTGSNDPPAGRSVALGRSSRTPPKAAQVAIARPGVGAARPEASDPGTEAAPRDRAPDGEGSGSDTGGSDTGGTAPSGDRGTAGDGPSSTTAGDTEGLSVTIRVPGTSAGATAGIGGVSGSDSAEATSDDSSQATLEITDTEGTSTEVGVDVPGSGTVLP